MPFNAPTIKDQLLHLAITLWDENSHLNVLIWWPIGWQLSRYQLVVTIGRRFFRMAQFKPNEPHDWTGIEMDGRHQHRIWMGQQQWIAILSNGGVPCQEMPPWRRIDITMAKAGDGFESWLPQTVTAAFKALPEDFYWCTLLDPRATMILKVNRPSLIIARWWRCWLMCWCRRVPPQYLHL